MLKILTPLIIIGGLAAAGNWYVAAYGHDLETRDLIKVQSFSDCVAAGYPVLESYPAQCITETGDLFIQTPEAGAPAHTDSDATEPTELHGDHEKAMAMAAARSQAAKDLGVSEALIDLISITEHEWPDGCLGLSGPEEACIMMITFGYEITLAAEGSTVTYRTDQTGAVVKKE